MESYFLVALCLAAMVALSQQYDDRVLSLKEASLARLAKRERRGSRLRVNGEYLGPNGGSLQGTINRDVRKGLDFFRGAARRGRTNAAFDARLPSGAGFGGRTSVRSQFNAGLTGASGSVGGRFEGGINDAYGNHFGGGFQGGFRGGVRVPIVAAGYVDGPYGQRDFIVG